MDMSKRNKSAKQIASIKDVQRAVELAMGEVVSYLRFTPSPTSEQAHTIIDTVLREHDCESPEGHIIAGGGQSAEPHEHGTGILKKGVPIVIDIYPRSCTAGYYADMTRTVCLGLPEEKLQNMYDAVLHAQELAIGMVRPGVVCLDIQIAVEEFFKSVGYATSGKGKEFAFAEGFVHSIGHGVGKDIHETPHFGRNGNYVLIEGDVITIEPGLYYKDIGGVRLEDMLLVTKDGFENLTHFPKQFSL